MPSVFLLRSISDVTGLVDFASPMCGPNEAESRTGCLRDKYPTVFTIPSCEMKVMLREQIA
jgi:hypothetical protein